MNTRDFEDKVLDGSITLPHASLAELIDMVDHEIKNGAPNALWAIEGIAEDQELPQNMIYALEDHYAPSYAPMWS